MLTLVYGVHRPDCPMGTFVHDMARVLPVRGERAHA